MASPLPQVLDTIPEAAGALGAPAEPESRATLIDALRGFALFGVVWSNYVYFTSCGARSRMAR